MSTNINISVGDNKLLAQASLQQNASRQAQLEKESNKRLQSKAEINRVNALAAQGKDANGKPLTNTLPKVTKPERELAANRFRKYPSLWYFTEAPNPTGAGRYNSNYATNNTRLLKNSALIPPATRRPTGEEEEPVQLYNFLAAEEAREFIFVPGSPNNDVFGQNIIQFPYIADNFINRIEWTNFNGDITDFDGTSSLEYINKPSRPEFTLEYDILIGEYPFGFIQTGGQIRLFNSVTDAAVSDSNLAIDLTIRDDLGFFQVYLDATSLFIGDNFRANETDDPYPDDTPEGPYLNFFSAGRVWRRYALTVTSSEVLLHVNGIYKRSLAFDPSILLGFEAVGWAVDGSLTSVTGEEGIAPSFSAVRFTQKALYGKESYTPCSLLERICS